MKHRILAAVLALLLLAGLTGCSGGGAASTTAATEATTVAATTAAADESGLEMSDVAGMTAPGVLPIVTEPVTLTVGIIPNASVTDYEDNLFTHYVEENTGIDLEFYFFPSDGEEAKQKLLLMVSSNQELPDLWSGVSLEASEKYSLGRDGYVLDLTDYMERYAYYYSDALKWAGDIDKTNMEIYSKSVDGKMYVMPVSSNDPTDNTANGMYINKKWLDTLGLDVPETTAELKEALIAFRDNDPNGNGQKDEIPMLFALAKSGYATKAFKNMVGWFGEYYGQYTMNVEDGKVYYPFTTDTYRESLAFMRELVSEDLFSSLSFTLTTEQYYPLIEVSDTGADQTVGVFCAHPTLVFTSSEPTAFQDYVYLPTLSAENGKEPYATYDAAFTSFSTMISAKCEHPEVAFRMLDFFCKEESCLSARYGQHGEHWEFVSESDIDVDSAFFPNSVFGYEPYWVEYENPFASTNNYVWRCTSIYLIPTELFGSSVSGDQPTEAQKYRTQEMTDGVVERLGHLPDEMIANLILTEDEQNQIAEIKTSIDEYAAEMLTAFVSGTVDLDTGWDDYVATLDGMGLEQYVSVAQTAYSRMTGK